MTSFERNVVDKGLQSEGGGFNIRKSAMHPFLTHCTSQVLLGLKVFIK